MTQTKISFFGIDRQYKTIREEILEITDQVYTSGQVLDGVWTKNFEKEMAFRTGRKYAVAVNSGTQALIFALRTIEDQERSKVLIPAQSFIATVNAVLEAGFEPVFCDVDPLTGLIDVNKIPEVADDIAAVMYVNLFGNVIDYDRLIVWQEFFSQRKIPVIEDAAQSFGAAWKNIPSGKLGTISCLSFDPTKNLNNYGSGGMVLTDDYPTADVITDLRDNGKKGQHVVSGTNSKMSESDCAQMLIKLRHFDAWQLRRKEIADYYTSELQCTSVKLPPVDANVTHAWHKYVIHVNKRLSLQNDLMSAGIETKIHYQHPLHLSPLTYMSAIVSYANAVQNDTGVLEGAEEFSKTCLSLPIYPELTDSEVEYIIQAVVDNVW